MTQHYRRAAESDLGAGVVYIEAVDGWPVRQVEIYGETWRWADDEHPEWLADQPLDVLDLGVGDAISKREFEDVWKEAMQRCPPSL